MRRLPMTDLTTKLLYTGIALIPGSLIAHPLHHTKPGFNEGFQHSLFSWEHLLIALALGFLAASIRSSYQRPIGKLLALFTVGYVLSHLQAVTLSLGSGLGLIVGFLLTLVAGYASYSLTSPLLSNRWVQWAPSACALITLVIFW